MSFTRHTSRHAFLAVLFSTGCVVGPGASDGRDLLGPGGMGCRTARPASLDDCAHVGLSFADCGGIGADPVFACDSAECLWFARGCAPAGWQASACPADDLCCVDGGPWTSSGGFESRVSTTTYAWGTSPWDDVREMNLVGSIGTVPATNDFTCAGFPPPRSGAAASPCDTPMHYTNRGRTGVVTITLGSSVPNFSGWTLSVEAVRDDSTGAIRARACRTEWSDLAHPDHCLPGAGPHCATGGTMTLDAWPGTRASMHLVFDDGTIDATL